LYDSFSWSRKCAIHVFGGVWSVQLVHLMRKTPASIDLPVSYVVHVVGSTSSPSINTGSSSGESCGEKLRRPKVETLQVSYKERSKEVALLRGKELLMMQVHLLYNRVILLLERSSKSAVCWSATPLVSLWQQKLTDKPIPHACT
jgi:hypothetical protein